MSVFKFDTESVLNRALASPQPVHMPTLSQSLWIGTVGFTLTSLIVYSVWAFGGRWFYATLGEAGFYAVCAALFVGLAGYALHWLIIGPGALYRFYAVFAAGFLAYAILWCLAWFGLRGKAGEWLGSLAGSFGMALVFAIAFSSRPAWLRIGLVLFLTHSAGYFLGGVLFEYCKSEAGWTLFGPLMNKRSLARAGMILWGAAYGLGFGMGLSYMLHACQEPIRSALKQTSQPHQDRVA